MLFEELFDQEIEGPLRLSARMKARPRAMLDYVPIVAIRRLIAAIQRTR